MVMPDSTEYYGYLKIFYGQEPMSEWNIVRGPSFPLILFLSTVFFGNNQRGILIGSFILFCIMLIIGFKFIKRINFRNKFEKVVCFSLYILGIMFNPMIIGYMHGLLTESVAIPMFFISVLLAVKWMKQGLKLWKKITLSILIVISTVFMWFVKQPYVFVALAPALIAWIIAIVDKPKLKNFIYRTSVILITIISVVVSIKIWNTILIKNNVDMDTGRDTNSFIKEAVINGDTAFSIDFYPEHYEKEFILESDVISSEDKKKIVDIFDGKSEYKSFKLINVFGSFSSREEDSIVEKIVLYSKEEKYTTADALKMYFKLFAKYPQKTLKSYVANYLAIADIVPSVRHKDANVYYPSTVSGYYFENQSIGYSIYNSKENMLWLDESHHLYKNVENLKTENKSNSKINRIIYSDFGAVNFTFKVTMLGLPILFVALIFVLIIEKKRKLENSNFKIAFVFIGSSFIHMIFHAVTGAIIDRYATPIWAGCIIAILILVFEKWGKKNNNDMEIPTEVKLNEETSK